MFENVVFSKIVLYIKDCVMAKTNVIPFAPKKYVQDTVFEPPKLPVLLEVRKCMGLTIEEAASALYVSKETLESQEALGYPTILNDIEDVLKRYAYFLSMYGNNRERNLVKKFISLREVRHCYFKFTLKEMGTVYGGYTARAWYLFEVHEVLLPRHLLEQIEYDFESA
jgi:hypothetical protein